MLNFTTKKLKGFPVVVETVASVNTLLTTKDLRVRLLQQSKNK